MMTNMKIDQRYDVVKNLGGGLSGEVVLIKDHDELKALKFLKKIQMNVSREDALRNFKNEFSILKELNHPNISRILDFGYEQRLQKYYFTTEFISGAEFHKACENQPLDVIEKLIVQVLRALNYLHSRGIYHFDIKPQNILVYLENDAPTTAKIIDFGLAGFTSPRKKVGTPAYMAPEVIQGGVLDGRTDLYSFGVLIYKILTGTNPFVSKNLKEILNKQVSHKPKPPSEINPDIPKYWDHIVERLLEKNPVNRYSQASLVIRDLNFLSNKKFEIETKDTKLSYLPEKGTLIGREEEWQTFAEMFGNVFMSDTLPDEKTLIMQGEKGTGKTRLLNEIKYFSQLRNVPVKSIHQSETEENLNNFILMADDPHVDANRVNALMQKHAKDKCLIIWATEKAPHHWADTRVITLSHYDKEQLKQYLESVTGLSSAPDKLIDEVYKRTQGNPLFVTEFIKLLLDSDLLFDASGKWDATTFDDIKIDFHKIRIPSSVEEILLDTFKKHSKSRQEILKWLAVHNTVLHIDSIKTLSQIDNIHAEILTLIKADILEKTSREHTYFFKNLLFVDVIYKLIPTNERATYHDKLAKLLINNDKEKSHYLYHAGHGSDLQTATKSLYDLGTLHLDSANHDEAIKTFRRLISLQSNEPNKDNLQSYFKLGTAYFKSRKLEDAISVYGQIKDFLAHTTNPEEVDLLLKAFGGIVESWLKIGDFDKALSFIKETKKFIPLSPKQKIYDLLFKNFHAFILLKKNEIDEAKSIYLKTHQAWVEELNEKEKLEVVNNRLLEIYLVNQEYDKAIETCLDNIKYLQKANSKYELALNYYALGDVYHILIVRQNREDRQELIKKCAESFLSCEKVARETNEYGLMYRAFNGLGNLYSDEKENAKALDYYNRALTVARKNEDLLNAAFISYNIGYIHGQEKQHKDSYAYLIYAINTLEDLKGLFSPHREHILFLSNIYLAEIHTLTGEFDKGHKAIDKAEIVLNETEYLKFREFWKEIRRAHLYCCEKKMKEATKHLKKATALANTEEDKAELHRVQKLFKQDPSVKTTEQQGVKIMSTTTKTSGDDLKKIIEINRFINSEYDTDQLLKIVLNYAIQLSNAESGFVMLLNEEGNLVVKESLNTNSTDEEKISMSVASMAIEKGEIISSSDALSDDRFDSSESIVLNELKSVLCLPIRSKYKSIGVFYLDNRYRVNAFEDCNVNLLNAFCDQVGIALENSKLINQLMGAKTQLKQRLDKTTAELTEVKNILKTDSETYQTKYAYKHIISKSEPMQEMFKILDKVTETNLSMFIYGESGTGKELVAKALHYNNPARQQNRFVAINCGAIPANLMESELFGHKAGSFTGANKDKRGLFEEANGGTILLDEIGELDSQLQVKLLRVLQEGEVQRIGDTKTIKVDTRVVCASHKDLESLVKQKQFREDLYYRICQMKIDLPALRDRPEDIPVLAKHFVEKFREQNKVKEEVQIPPIFMKALLEYEWPGNIRELENLLSVAFALKDGNMLSIENIPPNYGIKKIADQISHANLSMNLADMSMSQSLGARIDASNVFDQSKTWHDYESMIIARAYEANNKKKVQTAEVLGVSHSTIYKKVSDLDLDDPSNTLYAEIFVYDGKSTMKEYIHMVFKAALEHHNNHPYAAIRQLAVSQGYFYKIMKEFKREESMQEMLDAP